MKRLFTTSIITLRYLVIQIQCLLRVIQITFHQGIAKRIFGTCWSCVKFYSLNSRKFPSDECLKCAIGHIWSVCRAIVSIATNKDKPCGLDLIRLSVSGDHYLNPRCWKVKFPIVIRLFIWHDSIHDFIVDTGSIELYPGAELNEALLA